MTPQEFQTQINRLSDTFGAQNYRHERVQLIWREVKDYGGDWFAKVVNELLSSSRQAPLPNDFAGAVSEERERLWKIEKEMHARDAKNFMAARFSDDDKRTLIQGIIQRITGRMSDDNWGGYLVALNGAVDTLQPVKCKKCEDEGIVTAYHKENGNQYVFKCTCRGFQNDSRNFPQWLNRYEAEFQMMRPNIGGAGA